MYYVIIIVIGKAMVIAKDNGKCDVKKKIFINISKKKNKKK